jgi:hypothetical protein
MIYAVKPGTLGHLALLATLVAFASSPSSRGAGPAAGVPPAAASSPAPVELERLIRAHVTYLADDLMEGRGAGTRGHGLAMNYVAAQFARLGIEPGGDKGYQQPVAMRESRLNLDSARFVIRHEGTEVSLAPLNDMIVRPAAGTTSTEVTAPAVFVGFGIHAPEFGYDDFAGDLVDVRGKIAVVLAASPASLPSTARAYYSREKNAELARRGAVGLVTLETPAEEKRRPWSFAVNAARFPAMRLLNDDGSLFESYPELRATASVSRTAGAALFKHAPKAIEAAFTASEKSQPQFFPLNIELTLAARSEISDLTSANVLGWLPGTDPALAGEPLVVSAHLDHLGLGPAINGDTIYNGALDNALGTAVLLATAEQLATGPRPRRPVLFASVTAEEKGGLGASHLARHPPKRVLRFAGDINLDMPVILGPTRDVIGIGAEHTTLGASLATAAARLGFTVSPDPQPEEVVFVRSDQYQFVRAGIPAIFLKSGQKSLDPAIDLAALEADFRKNHYHKPSDDLSRPIHWKSSATFTQLATELVRTAADAPAAPAFNPNDFFGTRFKPAATQEKR